MPQRPHSQSRSHIGHPWIVSAVPALGILLALGFAAGCKLDRSKIRGVKEEGDQKGGKKLGPPRTLHGTFVVDFESSPGKKFPVHMSFVIDFAENRQGAAFTTCIDSDGGLGKSGTQGQVLTPDRAVPIFIKGASEEVAKGISPSSLRCVRDDTFEDRARLAGNGLNLGTVSPSNPGENTPASAPVPGGASPLTVSGSTDTRTSTTGPNSGTTTSTAPAGKTPLTKLNLDDSTATGSAILPLTNTTPGNTTPGNTTPGNTTPGNTTPGNTTAENTDEGKAPPGAFILESAPDANGKRLRLVLRANDAGWQVENINYYGFIAWVERTITLAMWGK